MTNVSRFGRIGAAGRAASAACVFLWSLGGLLSGACRSEERLDPAIEKLGRATGPVEPMRREPPPAAMQAQPVESTGKEHRGTILETINVPNYTYIHFITEAKEDLWAAVPLSSDLRKGQSIELVESIVMKDFPSRSLGRSFSSIIFGFVKPEASADSGAAAIGDAGSGEETPRLPALPPGHPPINAR